jgi:hypothetical protein
MGLGIWAMHHVAMLAFHLPAAVRYHVPTVGASLEAGDWNEVEVFVRRRTHAEFSHGVCPECLAREWGAASEG